MMVLSMKLASCHLSGTLKCEMASRFLENFCTPAIKKKDDQWFNLDNKTSSLYKYV